MATEDLTHFAVSDVTTGRPAGKSFARRVAAGLHALASGMRASKDYRHLTAMSDRQLASLGLSRDRIPQELHRRHFAELGERLD